MSDGRYHGSRFSAAKRAQLMQEAWQMHLQGVTQKNIGIELGVSQPTVFYWLAAVRRELAKEAKQ